ncbi:hypothetical protein P152DRAFT_167235 [Eremomyces bilateralis CBS 781.70]|uniref:Monopolin complex subunit Csm1/Pcs1 C-terminal domain-containing protein n=1 Tax=Eremomyces bilateralis CBS 781.70 TaxID=1392243 RepID=A0A6G1FUA9_9PEZI|nr:uncharacterized protein P152DRAFT_167235 [Eremomyces bilateralis CBS 781.70]KAF1809249.1 hypothetical protein P152DRAFT_167235 [Eremomyces bilateralis CBS 781.70]
MPKRAAATSLAQLVDPLSDDDFQSDHGMMPTPDSTNENVAPSKRKGTAKPKPATTRATNRVAKKPAARRTSGASLVVTGGTKRKAGTTKASRAALAERPNPAGEVVGGSDTEEVDEFDAAVEDVSLVEIPMPPVEAVKPAKGKAGKTRAPSRSRARATIPAHERNGRPAPRKKGRQEVIVEEPEEDVEESVEEEEQAMAMEVDEPVKEEEEAMVPVPVPVRTALRPIPSATASARTRSTSRQPQPLGMGWRGGSFSDTERSSDPMLRRRIGELTKKMESLELKYRNLRVVGMQDAETNFDRLRQGTDQRAKAQDDLIASLKRELSIARSTTTPPPDTSHLTTQITTLTTQLTTATAQSKSLTTQTHALTSQNHSLTSENQRLATKLDALTAENAGLHTDSKSLSSALHSAQSDAKSLSAALQSAQSENRSLAAKLASTRASSAPAETGKPPASTKKALPVVQRGAGGKAAVELAVAEKEREVREMRVKEELYSDLTGLMIRAVKRGEREDVFDCIQTGPNGTLRFNLHVPSPDAPSKGSTTPHLPSSNAYEDDEIGYTPLLDAKNDRELLAILPDYLTEEICFPRGSAAKFYGRVMGSMSARVEMEG